MTVLANKGDAVPEFNALNAFVTSGELDTQSPSVLLMDQAHGWLKSAEWIAIASAQTRPNGGVPHALPALFALYHGIELFIKGVTYELSNCYENDSHDLELLQAKYDSAIRNAARPELHVTANVQRFIEWDRACRSSGKNESSPPRK